MLYSALMAAVQAVALQEILLGSLISQLQMHKVTLITVYQLMNG